MGSVGGKTCQDKCHSPVAWAASGRETEHSEPADKAIFRMVSELPGRSESERKGDPEILAPEAEPASVGRRQHETLHMAEATDHSGGAVATARRQGRIGELEKSSPPRSEICGSWVGPITEALGKGADGGRMSDGPEVAMRAGNSAGAKRPCCSESFAEIGRQG